METALGSEFFVWRSNPPEKVLLKFYLLHSNLAVCKIHEDNLAIAPASWQCYALTEGTVYVNRCGAVVLSVDVVRQDPNAG